MDALVNQHRNYDVRSYNQLRFVASEILTNRIENAYPNSTGKLYVEFFIKDDFFEVSVRDMGVPHWIDLSYNEESIAKDKSHFRKFLLDKCIDSAGLEKLGKEGQRVFIRRKIRNPLEFEPPKPYKETEALDTNVTIRAVSTEEDAIEAIRCIYSEYGYSYAYEKLYYVENLLRMIKDGEIMSFIAVNDHGQTAGHFALTFSDLFRNMPELSTVVTRKQFRGLGLFAKFIAHAEKVAEEKGVRAIMAQPVAFHPMSQKAFLRAGYTATSLLLSYIGSDIESEYNKDGNRLDLFACVRMIDKNASCTLYPPEEIRDFTADIYRRLNCKAEIKKGFGKASENVIKIEENTILKMKRIVLLESGGDIEQMLKDMVMDSIRKKHEMIELFISLRSPTCQQGYDAAKKSRFTLSGLMPGGENDDYVVMQLLIKNDRSYSQLVTVGEFEELTRNIKALAEKE